MRGLTGFILVAAIVLACGTPAGAQADAGAAGPACRTGSDAMLRTELIFGTERQSRPPVTDDEWKTFVDDEVAQRFPDGFTLLDGQGEWRGSRGLVRERSHVVIIWYKPAPEQQDKLEALRSIYKTRFGQDSVARIDGADCVSF